MVGAGSGTDVVICVLWNGVILSIDAFASQCSPSGRRKMQIWYGGGGSAEETCSEVELEWEQS